MKATTEDVEYFQNYYNQLEKFQNSESMNLSVREYMNIVPELVRIKNYIEKLKKLIAL